MPTNALTTYKALSFDVFGTIIDWQRGFLPHLLTLTNQLPSSHPAFGASVSSSPPSAPSAAAIAAFNAHEVRLIKAKPTALYEDILADTYRALAEEWNVSCTAEDAEAIGPSIGCWQAFPDSVDALKRLGKHYKLVALSNISNDAINAVLTTALGDVKFDAVYTAETIGSYKPDKKNFDYLIEGVEKDLGVEKGELLHVSHGVKSDQVPAEEFGLGHVWIERGEDNWGDVKKTESLRWWPTLREMADAVQEEFKDA